MSDAWTDHIKKEREENRKLNNFKLFELRGQGHEKLLKGLDTYIKDLIESKQNLQQKLSDYNKEGEISKLKDKIYELETNSLHVMSKKEKDASKEFRAKHYELCNSNVQYILEGTGIGTAITMRCKKCDVKQNITDTDNW